MLMPEVVRRKRERVAQAMMDEVQSEIFAVIHRERKLGATSGNAALIPVEVIEPALVLERAA